MRIYTETNYLRFIPGNSMILKSYYLPLLLCFIWILPSLLYRKKNLLLLVRWFVCLANELKRICSMRWARANKRLRNKSCHHSQISSEKSIQKTNDFIWILGRRKKSSQFISPNLILPLTSIQWKISITCRERERKKENLWCTT